MRVVLFTGKGGVGKTTSALAAALAAARAGRKTLVVSSDQAHSVGDVLGAQLDGDPREVAANLFALHCDAHRDFTAQWGRISAYLSIVLGRGGLDEVAAEQVLLPPGAAEISALLAVRDHAAAGTFDVVVLDCAPSAETLRLLAFPRAMGWYVDRLLGRHRRLARTLGPLITGDAGLVPGEEVFDAVAALRGALADVGRLLCDPAVTSARLVLTPEAVVVAEARRTYTSLVLHGCAVDGVVVNRVIPDGDDPWRAGWAAAQRRQLAEIEQSFGHLDVRRVAYAPDEPVGVGALGRLARATYGEADPAAAPSPAPAVMSVAADGDGRVLRLALPLAGPSDVDVVRVRDDVAVTVHGQRRLFAIPGTLLPLRVAGARLRDGFLCVRFTPREGTS